MTSGSGCEREQLVRELTGLRERGGLSLSALALRTTASKSSWHRYLTGAQLPPGAVVEELCSLVGEPPGRIVALRDLAERSDGDGDGDGDGEEDVVPPPPPPPSLEGERPDGFPAPQPSRRRVLPRARGTRLLLAAMTVTLVLAATATASAFLRESDSAPAPLGPGCDGMECAGRPSQPLACAITGAGTRTVAERRPGRGLGAAMDIRYSPACDASWARVWFGRIGDRIEISTPGQESRTAEIQDRFDAENYLSTPMLGGGPEGLTLCLIPVGTTERACIKS